MSIRGGAVVGWGVIGVGFETLALASHDLRQDLACRFHDAVGLGSLLDDTTCLCLCCVVVFLSIYVLARVLTSVLFLSCRYYCDYCDTYLTHDSVSVLLCFNFLRLQTCSRLIISSEVSLGLHAVI